MPVLLANTEDLGNLFNVISSKQQEIFMQLQSEIKCQTVKKAVIIYPFQSQALSSGDTETPATPQSQPREKWQQTQCCSQLICQDRCNAEEAEVQWQKQKGKIVSYLKSNKWSMKLPTHLDFHEEDQHTHKKSCNSYVLTKNYRDHDLTALAFAHCLPCAQHIAEGPSCSLCSMAGKVQQFPCQLGRSKM